MFILEIDKVETGSDVKHKSTSWQVYLTPNINEDNLLFESLEDEDNLLRIKVPLPLNDDNIYYSRTKIHFSDGTESDWSKLNVNTRNASGFNFSETIVVTPTLSTDFDKNNTPLGGFIVKGSEFKLFSGIGSHKHSNWYIKDDKDNLIWSRINDTFNLTSIRIPNNILHPGRMYTVECMYVTDTNAYSNYGKLYLITNADLINKPEYLERLGITDLKAYETNTSLRNMVINEFNINDLMSKLIKANILIGLQKNKLNKCKQK